MVLATGYIVKDEAEIKERKHQYALMELATNRYMWNHILKGVEYSAAYAYASNGEVHMCIR